MFTPMLAQRVVMLESLDMQPRSQVLQCCSRAVQPHMPGGLELVSVSVRV